MLAMVQLLTRNLHPTTMQYRTTLCVLAVLNVATANPTSEHWVCSGKQTQLTVLDCQTLAQNNGSCYHLPLYSQYRPCVEICDGVKTRSLDEERCMHYCPNFVEENCELSSQIGTGIILPIAEATSTQRNVSPAAEKEAAEGLSNEITILLPVVVSLLVIAVLIVLCILCKVTKKSQKRKMKVHAVSVTTPLQNLGQELNEIGYPQLKTSMSVEATSSGTAEGIGNLNMLKTANPDPKTGNKNHFQPDKINRHFDLRNDNPNSLSDFRDPSEVYV